jgi:hypothetical protein
MSSSTNLKIKWESHKVQHDEVRAADPVVGATYRDSQNRSFAVLSIGGDAVLLEFADGVIATVKLRDWYRLCAKSAAF